MKSKMSRVDRFTDIQSHSQVDIVACAVEGGTVSAEHGRRLRHSPSHTVSALSRLGYVVASECNECLTSGSRNGQGSVIQRVHRLPPRQTMSFLLSNRSRIVYSELVGRFERLGPLSDSVPGPNISSGVFLLISMDHSTSSFGWIDLLSRLQIIIMASLNNILWTRSAVILCEISTY